MYNMIGEKFGKLTVLEKAEDYICQPSGLHERQYLCKCDCGNENLITVKGHYLRKGVVTSCGCTPKERKRYRKKYNKLELLDDYGIGYTSNNTIFYFDKEDYELVKEKYWSENPYGYIVNKSRQPQNKIIYLHRYIMNPKEGELVDHINHNKADNRKCNLRICTSSQNGINKSMMSNNKSGYTGVVWLETVQKWKAQIRINKKNMYLGTYENIEDAIKARRDAEIKYFGEWSFKESTGYETNEKIF